MLPEGVSIEIRAVVDLERWWRIDWRLDWLIYLLNLKASRPKGLPLLRVTM